MDGRCNARFHDLVLIYNKTREEHLQHIKIFFEALRKHQLFAKQSKCTFATTKVEYLGHVISANGVSTDPHKIQAVKD
jgi:hypothetical protein